MHGSVRTLRIISCCDNQEDANDTPSIFVVVVVVVVFSCFTIHASAFQSPLAEGSRHRRALSSQTMLKPFLAHAETDFANLLYGSLETHSVRQCTAQP